MIIKDLFEKYTSPTASSNRKSIEFIFFKQIIDCIQPGVPDIRKAELYRESYNIGGGIVNNECFFIAATESGFFAKTLRLRSMKKAP